MESVVIGQKSLASCRECESPSAGSASPRETTVRVSRGGAEGAEEAELLSIIRWTRTKERLPACGHTVALWIPSLDLVVRGYRDARITDQVMYRVTGTEGPAIPGYMVEAFTELPQGALPAPEGGI